MAQPVHLSEPLVQDARAAAADSDRSIAKQIEYWARLGRGVETLLRPAQAVQLRRLARPLAESLAQVGTEKGKARLRAHLGSQPFPHFRGVSGKPELLERVESDGSRQIGHFVAGRWVSVRNGGSE